MWAQNVIVKPSTLGPAVGDGLFAVKAFEAGNRICPYAYANIGGGYSDGSVVLSKRAYTKRPIADQVYGFEYAPGRVIDAAGSRDPGKYANFLRGHNNAEFTKTYRKTPMHDITVWLRATKHIDPGEEIFVDYGPEYQFEDEIRAHAARGARRSRPPRPSTSRRGRRGARVERAVKTDIRGAIKTGRRGRVLLPWAAALRQWNEGHDAWCIPRRGSDAHGQVRAIMEGRRPAAN
jgi:hypothetical protein